MLEQRGLSDCDEVPDALAALAAMQRSRPRVFGEEKPRHGRLAVNIDGFSLHAGTFAHENDRRGLEHLLAYAARSPVALSRLSRLPDGRYRYALKYPLPDGSMELILSGQQLMERLALLVPRPRVCLTRYWGVFASNSAWRPLIVPRSSPRARKQCPAPNPATPADASSSPSPDSPPPPPLPPGPVPVFAPPDDVYPPPPAPSPRQRVLDLSRPPPPRVRRLRPRLRALRRAHADHRLHRRQRMSSARFSTIWASRPPGRH